MHSSLSHRSWRRLGVCAAALALTATACSSSDSSDSAATGTARNGTTVDEALPTAPPGTDADASQSPTSAPTAGTTPTGTPVVPEALQFTAPLVGGGQFSGADFADKPTLFWFWAPT